MLHVACDVIGIAQYHFFEIQDGGHVFWHIIKIESFFIVNLYWKMLEIELKRI